MNSGRKLQQIPLSKKTLNHLCKRKSLNILKYFEVPGVCSKRSVESFVRDQLVDDFQNLRKITKAWVTCWDFGGILHKDMDLSRLGPKYLPTERYQELNFRVKHSKHISIHYHSTEKPFQVERYSKFLKKNSIYTFASLSYPWGAPKKTSRPQNLWPPNQKIAGHFLPNNHLIYMKPYTKWDKLPTSTGEGFQPSIVGFLIGPNWDELGLVIWIFSTR